MEYKASLDWPGKIITGSIFFLWVGLVYKSVVLINTSDGDFNKIWPNMLTVLLIVVTLIACYLFAPQGYVINETGLIIKRPVRDVKINFNDFQALKMLEDYRILNGIRIFGVGGLFGYFGKFYLGDLGFVTGYATKRTGRVLIVTRQDEKIIVTPDDKGFVDELKKRLPVQA